MDTFYNRKKIGLVAFVLLNLFIMVSGRSKHKLSHRKDKIHISHEYRDPRYARKREHEVKPNFNAPQLKKKEKEYLAKIEDALQSEEGSLLYTNSWAVQLHQAEVAQADRIAEKHGFENMGQVGVNFPAGSIHYFYVVTMFK